MHPTALLILFPHAGLGELRLANISHPEQHLVGGKGRLSCQRVGVAWPGSHPSRFPRGAGWVAAPGGAAGRRGGRPGPAACGGRPSAAAIWSITPQGAPTTLFSTCTPAPPLQACSDGGAGGRPTLASPLERSARTRCWAGTGSHQACMGVGLSVGVQAIWPVNEVHLFFEFLAIDAAYP